MSLSSLTISNIQQSKIIRRAAKFDIELSPDDFVWDFISGWTIDGMPADEWLDAMTLD